MEHIGRGVVVLGLIAVAISAVAAGVAWWRWERIAFIAGDIPVPPRSEIIKSESERPQEGDPGLCKFYIRHPGSPEEIRSFYLGEMPREGWAVEEHDGHRMRLRKGERVLRLLIRVQKRATSFTINVSPCE